MKEEKKDLTYMRGTRVFLILLVLYALGSGFMIDMDAQSVMHQTYAGQSYMRAAMFFCTLCIMEVLIYISRNKK